MGDLTTTSAEREGTMHIHTKRGQKWRAVSVGKAGHVSSCNAAGLSNF
jgi:hypothetical protein